MVRCGAPFPAGITEDGQSEGADAVFVEDAVVVDEEPPWQVGIVVDLDLDVDVKPLVGAIEEADLEEFVDSLGPDLGVWGDLAEFLLEEFGLDRPIDAGSGLGKGEFEQGSRKLVESRFPWAIVIEGIGHFPIICSAPTKPFTEAATAREGVPPSTPCI